jgi:hypothetical protein
VLHLVEPPPPNPQDGLRVFAVFSGVAGAWRATHELDGRTLAGENIVGQWVERKLTPSARDTLTKRASTLATGMPLSRCVVDAYNVV